MKPTFALVFAALATVAAALSAPAMVRYVDLNSTSPTPPYTNWSSAATNIQSAVDVADAGDEIVVTNGVYETGGRVVDGSMTNRVAVTKPVTVRSANGPTVTVIQGYQVPGTISGDSAVRCVYLANGASLIGLTLTNGATRSSGDVDREQSGGGLWCEGSTAVVSNCVLSGNAAYKSGGGVYNGTLYFSKLIGNSTIMSGTYWYSTFGGGAYRGILNKCTLAGNTCNGLGGGAYDSTLNDCTLTGNWAFEGGGACNGTLNNCTVAANSADNAGGGVNGGTLNNCTVVGNWSGTWGGGANGSTLKNCIVYYNNANNHETLNFYGGSLNYCCTTPNPGGTSNFTGAPLFVDYGAGNLRLQKGSPCINVGNNAFAVGATDLDGHPRIVNGIVDVGAYEYQGQYLNVSATDGGSVTRDPDLPDYPIGTLVTVTATPETGYGFLRWTGDATGSTNPMDVLIDTNKTITAVFTSTVLTLTSQGDGTITKTPDKSYYGVGETVALNARAGRWHAFTGWLDGNVNNPRNVTIGESNAYTGIFTPTTPLETVTIGEVNRLGPVGMPAVVVDGVFILTPSASARGSASVTLSTTFPSGWLFYTLDGTDPAVSGSSYTGPFTVRRSSTLRTVAYNADFTQSVTGDPIAIVILPNLTATTDGGGTVTIEPSAGDYLSNSLAHVTATPASGWTFLQWLGDASGTNPVVNVTVTRNKTVRAVFGTTLTTTVIGGGNLVVSPLSSLYPYGCPVRLTPVPATGNCHALWANATAGRTNNPLTFNVTNANPTVTAVFASLGSTQTNYLSIIPDGLGQVTLTPSGNRYRMNTNVVLQAIAESGQEFIGWSGAASGSQNPLTVTMNSNKVITASFTKRPWLQGEGKPDLLSQDGFRLTLLGEFNAVYQFFGSPDWNIWLPLDMVTNTWGTVQFIDAAARTNGQRFYRAQAVE